jgi:hypothetical protein
MEAERFSGMETGDSSGMLSVMTASYRIWSLELLVWRQLVEKCPSQDREGRSLRPLGQVQVRLSRVFNAKRFRRPPRQDGSDFLSSTSNTFAHYRRLQE